MRLTSRFCFPVMSISLLLLAGCAAQDAKEAGRELGGQLLGQAIILFTFGPDALQEHTDRKREEQKRETYPYRSSITREEYIEWQERRDFERLYESLTEANREYPFSERPTIEDENPTT